MTCPYCDGRVALLTGAAVYPNNPELAKRWVHSCRGCGARVGCHPRSKKALGTLANAELRRWRSEAHKWFDPLWKKEKRISGCSHYDARSAGYAWLSIQLDVAPEHCHISMFDISQCRRVVSLAREKEKS